METVCAQLTQYMTNNFTPKCPGFSQLDWLLFQNYIFALILLLQEISDGNVEITEDNKVRDGEYVHDIPTLIEHLVNVYGFWKDLEVSKKASELMLDDTLKVLIKDAINEQWLSQDMSEFEQLQEECEKLIHMAPDHLMFYEEAISVGQLEGEWLSKAQNIMNAPDKLVESVNKPKRHRFSRTRRVNITKRDIAPLRKTKYGPNTRRNLHKAL